MSEMGYPVTQPCDDPENKQVIILLIIATTVIKVYHGLLKTVYILCNDEN